MPEPRVSKSRLGLVSWGRRSPPALARLAGVFFTPSDGRGSVVAGFSLSPAKMSFACARANLGPALGCNFAKPDAGGVVGLHLTEWV